MDPAERAIPPAADPHLAPRRMRASDADRQATVQVLQDATARGLLTPEEGSQRMSAAFATVHLADLPRLTDDLPAGAPAAASSPLGWGPLLAMFLEQLRRTLHDATSGRQRPVRLAAALVVLVVFVTAGMIAAHLVLDQGGLPDHGGFDSR